ncbi:MAG: septum formation inhibitor Maf [Lachnospiraceae bacterium]|nr:septum formation inhibitor Maf [Lachnospiraceae bacterium]
MKKIILASQSPRRRELLNLVRLDFEVIPSDCDEKARADSPEELVKMLSKLKCSDVAGRIIRKEVLPETASSDGYYVIGSDTIVVFDGNILGKPQDGSDAFRMLKMLSGNTHSVFTGVTVIDTKTGKGKTFYEKTDVKFIDADDEEIRAYVATGEPMDKAGAYGVQGLGAFLVEKINGDYFTVVGLPLSRLLRVLKAFDKENR